MEVESVAEHVYSLHYLWIAGGSRIPHIYKILDFYKVKKYISHAG